jgi:hypothetical protein
MHKEEFYTTYVSKTWTSDCDPLPASPLSLDGCGVCGGDNRTCTSSLELILTDLEPESAAAQMPSLGSVVAGDRMFPQPSAMHPALPPQPQNQSQLLYKQGHEAWAQSQVYCILELYGSKGQSHELLSSYGREDLVFSFGSHPGGNRAKFLMAEPSADEIGELERVELTVIGGEHWLDGTHAHAFGGIRLMLTMDLQRLLWNFPIQSTSVSLDQTTTFTWHFGAHGQILPTAMRQCHPDCTTQSAMSHADENDDEDRSLGAFTVETDRNGNSIVTPPLRRTRSTLDGCIERCTTTYEMISGAGRETRGGVEVDCMPNPTEVALCPRLYYPVCGADGRTYRNSCVSTALCAVVHHAGSCGIGRDVTYHATLEARRLEQLHEHYRPEESDGIPQQGVFGHQSQLSPE